MAGRRKTTRTQQNDALEAFGPGKVILLGEHGVVYGHPALAAPLSIGVTARAVPSRACAIRLPKKLTPQARALLQRAFDKGAALVGNPAVEVTVASELPVSMGLGSSGALSVACAKVLLKAAHRSLDPVVVCALAFEMEKEFHGTPSGVDHTTSARGELLFYRRPPGTTHGVAQAVSCPRPLQLVVAIAGARAGTKATVAALRERKEKWPSRYARVFETIGALVVEARTAIEGGELEAVGDLMNMNHGMLSALGLSSARIDSVVHAMRQAGALGAKLTGAGGDGGACIGLFENAKTAARKLQRAGVQCFVNSVGEPGP